MSRTYRNLHQDAACHNINRYYGLVRWQLEANGHLVSKLDEVRKLFLKVGNDPTIGHANYDHNDLVESELHSENYTIRVLHAHAFRNRSSYRQRIKGIRLSKRLGHHAKSR